MGMSRDDHAAIYTVGVIVQFMLAAFAGILAEANDASWLYGAAWMYGLEIVVLAGFFLTRPDN